MARRAMPSHADRLVSASSSLMSQPSSGRGCVRHRAGGGAGVLGVGGREGVAGGTTTGAIGGSVGGAVERGRHVLGEWRRVLGGRRRLGGRGRLGIDLATERGQSFVWIEAHDAASVGRSDGVGRAATYHGRRDEPTRAGTGSAADSAALLRSDTPDGDVSAGGHRGRRHRTGSDPGGARRDPPPRPR